MLRARDLRRTFAGVVALDGVSFEARPGEVLGLLGPNGAGKTTALRIVTGFLAAEAGSVEVCDVDAARDPRGARARIGYLPESAPLYGEMRVDEYLRYRAALKGLPRARRAARVAAAVEETGLGEVRRRVIGQLSKGYRQRVGLADALVHEPPVLILDEPTDGLDPNQRRDALALVARLAESRTVLLSTHILSEVQAVCRRAVILDRGRVVAAGALETLGRPHDLVVLARGPAEALRGAVAKVAGVESVELKDEPKDAGESRRLTVRASRDVREEVARAVVGAGALLGLQPAAALDDVFRRLTSGPSPSSPSSSSEKSA